MVEAGYAGTNVKTTGNEFYVVLFIVLAILAVIIYYVRKAVLSVPDAVKEIAAVPGKLYRGEATQEERRQAYGEMWTESDNVLLAYNAGKTTTKEFVYTPAWMNDPVVMTAEITKKEYETRKTEAETWMAKSADDFGISAPYGSEAYQSWAERHPVTAQSEVPVLNRTLKENVDFGIAKIQSWFS